MLDMFACFYEWEFSCTLLTTKFDIDTDKSNSLKPVVLLSISPSSKITFRLEAPFWCSRRLQPSAGARKKPPVGRVNFLVYLKNECQNKFFMLKGGGHQNWVTTDFWHSNITKIKCFHRCQIVHFNVWIFEPFLIKRTNINELASIVKLF